MSMPCSNTRSSVPIAGAVAGEGEAVADHHPEDRAERDRGERLRHGGEHVLLAHHAGSRTARGPGCSSSARGRSPRSSRRCRRRRSWPAAAAACANAGVAAQRQQHRNAHAARAARASARLVIVSPRSFGVALERVVVGLAGADAHGADRGRRRRSCRRRSGRSWPRCRSRPRPCRPCRRRRRPRS